MLSRFATERRELLEILHGPGRSRGRRFDLEDSQVVVHSARDVHHHVRLHPVEQSTSDERMPFLIDFTPEQIGPCRPSYTKLMVQLICVDSFAIHQLNTVVGRDRQKGSTGPPLLPSRQSGVEGTAQNALPWSTSVTLQVHGGTTRTRYPCHLRHGHSTVNSRTAHYDPGSAPSCR